MVAKRVLYAAFLALFAALVAQGATGGHLPVAVNVTGLHAVLVTSPSDITPPVVCDHGPTFPPDPWEDTVFKPKLAHGPTFPPDPWEDTTSTPKFTAPVRAGVYA